MENNNGTLENNQKDVKERDFRMYARILLKYAPLIIGITITTTAIAFIYSVMATEVYEAKTMLRIERGNINVLPGLDNAFYSGGRDYDFFQTQIKLFRSRSLIRATLNELTSMKIPFSPESAITEEQKINAFLGKVKVKPVPRSQLVHLCVEDGSSEKAALYANTLAQMYIQQSVEGKMSIVKHFGEWFDSKATAHEKVIRVREEEFKEFRKSNNIVELNIDLTAAKDTLKRLQSQLNDLEKKIADNDNLDEIKMFELEQKKAETQEEIKRKKDRIIELDNLSAQYNSYKKKILAAQNYYTILLNRAEEWTSSKDEFDPRNINIIDKAKPPTRPIKPRKTVNVLFGMIFGMILGVGIAFFIEYLDDTIKSPTDVENFLKVPFLGLIPTVSSTQDLAAIEGIVENQPKGTIAENYRAIRTNILFSSDRPVRQLVVTSTGPSEGKTTTAINIAEVMARAGDKTLIIDADMRRPRIHKVIKLEGDEKGLSNYLTGNATLDEIIHKSPIETLLVIPAGPIPPNPVEILNSPRLKELLDKMSERFDRIIIDTPPVIAVTDAAILARMADGVIFTVCGGRAHRDIVKRGINGLMKVGGHVFGVILNNVNIYRASYYDYYYYNYYRYAYGYGYREKKVDKKKRKKDSSKKNKDTSQL
ncbi:polysaccharide biosynthesis tyrosine autokinase [bacterium]|nr:polysaccharide biosynthesis tyrosine autokinase [bacterium]